MYAMSIFFARDKFNSPGDYVRFRNTKSYILQKHQEYFDTTARLQCKERRKQLCQLIGFANHAKFARRINEWKTLSSPIPEKYFETIGIDFHVLNFVVEQDLEEYKNALNTPYVIQNFVPKAAPCICFPVRLPQEMTEYDAVEFVKSVIQRERGRCFINISGLKTIFFEPDGAVSPVFFYPVMTSKKGLYYFTVHSNEDIGVARIG